MDIEYQGRKDFSRPRKLSETESLPHFQDKVETNAFGVEDERSIAADVLFTDLAKTYLKGKVLLEGLSKMDPAQFIPIEEFADSTRASAIRLDKDSSKDGSIITYSLYQASIDKILEKKWELRGDVINIRLPASLSQQTVETSQKLSGTSNATSLIKEFINQNGIITTIIGMLTISPFQTLIFQALTVEEGAKGVQMAQIPAGIALFLEIGIKAERIISIMKNANLATPLVEQQVVDLAGSEAKRAEALTLVGLDYNEFKKSQEFQDSENIVNYVSEYYRRYGGLDRLGGHLSIDHWVAYLHVAQNQQTIRGALNTSHLFSPKFQSIKQQYTATPPAPDNIFKEEGKSHSKIFVQLASATRSLKESSNDIYDDIINTFNYQLTDRDLCCVSGDTRIQHSEGNSKISDLVGKKIKVWNGDSWSEVSPFLAKKNQKLYRVHISDGSYLDCTDDHEWSIQKPSIGSYLWKKKKTLELKPGYKLPKFEMEVSKTGRKLLHAYEYGYYLGDGTSISENNSSIRTSIYVDKPELDLITSGCKIGYIKGPYDVSSEGYNHPKWVWHTPELDKDKCRSLKGKGIKGLPDWLFEADKESILEFIGGYIDSDGNLSNNGYTEGYRIFGTEDKIRDIQLLLRRASINFTTIRMEHDGETNKGKRSQPLWVCSIHSHNCVEIRTRLKTSSNFSKRYVSNGHTLVDKGVWQRIIKIEELPGPHDTFCFSEPVKHMGVFGNVLTHQCLVQIFGAIGNPDLMYTIASLLRILATNLSAELIRIQNLMSKFLANLMQDALFEITGQINEFYYKIVDKVTKAFTTDLNNLPACNGMFSLGWALMHSVRVLFDELEALIKEISSIIGDFGTGVSGSWKISADRRHLLGVARILEVLAARLDLANTCDRTSTSATSVTTQISNPNSDIDQAIFSILGSVPPNLTISEEDKIKHFPNTKPQVSSNLKFNFGIQSEQNNENTAKCDDPGQEQKIDQLIKNLTASIEQVFSNG